MPEGNHWRAGPVRFGWVSLFTGAVLPRQRHTAPKLEAAILEYLGQYSDPKKVRELLAASEKRELSRRQTELRKVERRMVELDADRHKDLELVRKGILNEDEFSHENEKRRAEAASLAERREELAAWVADQAERQANAAVLPKRVRSFLKDFGRLDVKRAKALLQSIVQTARVFNDGRIELAFR